MNVNFFNAFYSLPRDALEGLEYYNDGFRTTVAKKKKPENRIFYLKITVIELIFK